MTVPPDSYQISLNIIEAIKQHPVLYCTEVKGLPVKLQEFKQKVWKRIADELGLDATWVRLKWKNLRDTYCRILKYKNKTEEGARRKKWIFEDYLNFVKFPYEPDYQPQCIELTKEYIDEINSGEVTSEGLLEQLEDRNEDYTEYLEVLEETSADPIVLVPETIETLDNSDAQLVIQDTTSEQDVMQQDLDNYVQQIQSKYRKIRPKRMKINDPSTSKASKSNRIKKYSFQSNNASALDTNFVKFPYEPDYQPQCVELTKEYIDEINSGEVTSEGLLEQLEDRNEDYTEYLEDLEETSADPTILVPETIETLDNSDAQLVIQDTTSEQDVMQQDLDNYVQQIQSKYRKIRPKRMKINDPSTSKASKSNRIKKSSFQSNNASALNTNNTVANPVLVTNSSAPGTLPSPVKGQGGAKNSDAGAEQVYLARESKSIQLFFDSMAQTVKKLPPKAQADIKMHICKLVTEAEVRYSGQSMPQSTQQFIAPPGMIPKLVLIPCNMIDNQNAKN